MDQVNGKSVVVLWGLLLALAVLPWIGRSSGKEQMSKEELWADIQSSAVDYQASLMTSEQKRTCAVLQDKERYDLSLGLLEEFEAECRIFSLAGPEALAFEELWRSGARPDAFAFEFWFNVDMDHWNNITVGPFLTREVCTNAETAAREAVMPTTACRAWSPVEF